MSQKLTIRKLIQEALSGSSDYIEGGKTKGLTHDELIQILTNAAKGLKPGADKDKKPLKEEEAAPVQNVGAGAQASTVSDPVDAITIDIPLFLLLLEYAKENAKDDLDLHKISEKVNKMCKERGILTSGDYHDIVDDGDGKETLDEALTSRLREGIKSALFKKPLREAKKEKEGDLSPEELESSIKNDAPPAKPTPQQPQQAAPQGDQEPAPQQNTTSANQDGKVNPQVKSIQDALTQAQVAAQSLGDQKLVDQIGNTITFFTRAHIVGTGDA